MDVINYYLMIYRYFKKKSIQIMFPSTSHYTVMAKLHIIFSMRLFNIITLN